MIALEKHIEILLLWNDCVIVPGFGGFTASHVPARYDEADGMFIPPLRTLGFNQKLNVNDSLLVQSYTETYDLSYPEALKRIEEETNEIRQHIENDGSYTLNDIGRLYLTESGGIGFTPCEAGVLTPSLYSLSSFDMQRIGAITSHKEYIVSAPHPTLPSTAAANVDIAPLKSEPATETDTTEIDDEEEKTISIRLSALRNVAAVLIAVVGFFLLSTPVNNSTANVQMSKLEYGVVSKLFSDDVNEVKPVAGASTTVKLNGSKSETKQIAAKAQAKKTQADDAEPYFCLVLASRVTHKNATAYVGELMSKGYAEARVLTETGKSVKVVYGRYSTLNEASNTLNKLCGNSDFHDAWIYQVKH